MNITRISTPYLIYAIERKTPIAKTSNNRSPRQQENKDFLDELNQVLRKEAK